MSVLITAKLCGDTAKMRASLTERADEYEAITARPSRRAA